MKIDWLDYENKDHVLAWFLVEAMSEAGIDKFGDFNAAELNVELKVNGIEVPIVKPMEALQLQLVAIENGGKEIGKKEAIELIQERVEALFKLGQ